MRDTKTNLVYNDTSGSGAPQAPLLGLSELQMLVIVLKH